jgi:ABC-type uncharacterized transport system ATPase subunit
LIPNNRAGAESSAQNSTESKFLFAASSNKARIASACPRRLIVVEHDMQFIKMIDGIVTVLHQGRILIEDTMEKVLDSGIVREVYLDSGHARG